MEVKIGITDSPRELAFSSAQTPGEVEELVTAALSGSSNVLSLNDDKGRRYLINTAKIAYVEIGAADSRRVGFGIGADAKGKAAKSG
ncbi:ATP-binding protein [Mycobacterium shigaense]|nr:ATP-binding protein [Mycobacterium shigaense]